MGDVSFAAEERPSWRLRLPVARETLLCSGLAATLASLLAWLGPPGGDLAAHEYQRSLFLTHGFTLWDNFWYAGRYAFVGYSPLYYPLAAHLGIWPFAVLTVAIAAAAFALIVEREWGYAARWAGRSFALVWPGVVVAGQLPFALGGAVGLLALLALQSGRRWTGTVLIVLTLAASPVAFVLLAVVLGGVAVARRPALSSARIPALAIVLAVAIELVLTRLFPAGTLGFPLIELVEATAFCVGLLALAWRVEGAEILRGFLVVYLLAVICAYVIPSGLGHDITRLRQLALPVALLIVALRHWRPLPLAVAAVALAGAWNIVPLGGTWVRSAADHSSQAAVWTAPTSYLHTHLRPGYRVEAVDTSEHWPALYLARAGIPLVRGWFRQDDHPVAMLLYRPYTAPEYLGWLRRLGVAYVVLANDPLDYSSRREAQLIRSGRSGLRRVFATNDVSIYAVPRPQSIVAGPGRPRVLALPESGAVLHVPRAGTYHVALRWSPYWHASTGCLSHGPDGLLRLQTRSAATVRLAFDITPSGLFNAFAGTAPRCPANTG